jgi:hypothetical protein
LGSIRVANAKRLQWSLIWKYSTRNFKTRPILNIYFFF